MKPSIILRLFGRAFNAIASQCRHDLQRRRESVLAPDESDAAESKILNMHDILYCTECGAAYLAGTPACDYCPEAPLAVDAPPVEDLGPWEDFMDFADESVRWNVENILRGDGIPTTAWAPEAALRQVYPGLHKGAEASLRIPAKCFARARACLEANGIVLPAESDADSA